MYPTADGSSAANQAWVAGTGYAGTLGGQTPTNGRVQIPGLLDEQNGQVMELHKAISELEQRLSAVLAHAVPAEAKNSIDPPPPVQIMDRVQRSNQMIALAADRLRGLMQRLHL